MNCHACGNSMTKDAVRFFCPLLQTGRECTRQDRESCSHGEQCCVWCGNLKKVTQDIQGQCGWCGVMLAGSYAGTVILPLRHDTASHGACDACKSKLQKERVLRKIQRFANFIAPIYTIAVE